MLLAALVGSAATHAIGLEAVFGAFIAGIVLGRSRYYDAEVAGHLQSAALGFFAPLFFATAGLRVDLGLLADPEVAIWGVDRRRRRDARRSSSARFIGSRFAGLATREGLALAVGLNARGAVEIVLATVGLSIGVLNPKSYAVVVLMAVVDVGDGAAAPAHAAPRLARHRGGAGAARARARARRERARAADAHPAADARRAELGARGAHRRPDLARGRRRRPCSPPGADVPQEDVADVRAAFTRREARATST